MFKPNGHKEEYHIRKLNDESFLFEIGDKKYIYVGEKIISFETNDILLNFSYDAKHPFVYREENIYFVLYQKYIPIQESKTSTEKDEYQCLYEKYNELSEIGNESVIEYGNDFKSYKIFGDKKF